MALNRPDGAELLAAVRAFLEKTVSPQVDAGTQFHLRIANNVLAIVERELAQRGPADAAEMAGLRDVLGAATGAATGEGDADLAALNRLLVERIRAGNFDGPETQRVLLRHLKTTTAAKLAIDNPRYR
jgi:Domain of unknown function (DUF6285)